MFLPEAGPKCGKCVTGAKDLRTIVPHMPFRAAQPPICVCGYSMDIFIAGDPKVHCCETSCMRTLSNALVGCNGPHNLGNLFTHLPHFGPVPWKNSSCEYLTTCTMHTNDQEAEHQREACAFGSLQEVHPLQCSRREPSAARWRRRRSVEGTPSGYTPAGVF
jgi:hypothetical protein